ncbi:hypothetical protein UT300005_37300 [Clostridium sp. CTA-5]
MKTIFYVSLKNEPIYNKYTYLNRIVDKIKIKKNKDIYIKELDIRIKRAQIPANVNKNAYSDNISRALKRYCNKDIYLSLNGNRMYDLRFMSKFQKDIISYSIVQSIRIILTNMNKSIKSSNILIDVDDKQFIHSLLEELAKECRNVVLLTKDLNKIDKIREHIMSNYGLAIEVVYKEEAIKDIDFIITSKNNEYICPNVWYINNCFISKQKGIHINNVLYKVPWNVSLKNMPPQLIGALVKKERNKTISEILNSNEITLESIRNNNIEIDLVR